MMRQSVWDAAARIRTWEPLRDETLNLAPFPSLATAAQVGSREEIESLRSQKVGATGRDETETTKRALGPEQIHKRDDDQGDNQHQREHEVRTGHRLCLDRLRR